MIALIPSLAWAMLCALFLVALHRVSVTRDRADRIALRLPTPREKATT